MKQNSNDQNNDWEAVIKRTRVALDLFGRVWETKRFPTDEKGAALRWFTMGYVGSLADIDALNARVTELEAKLGAREASKE